MNWKRVIIITAGFVLLVGLIATVMLIINSNRQNDNQVKEGFILFEFENDDISIAIPEHWDTFAYEDAQDGLNSFWNEDNNTFFNVSVGLDRSISIPDINDFQKENLNYEVTLSSNGKSISYSGTPQYTDLFESEEGDASDELVTAYTMGKIVSHKGGALSARCTVKGLDYKRGISTCEDILNSLND